MDSLIFGKSLKMSRKIALSARFQRVMLSLDILRIPEKYQKYRYANKSQHFYGIKNL